jgi:hypothetical protein
VTDRADPFRSFSCALLTVLADEGRPMSLHDLQSHERLTPPEAVRQLSVARVAGFVRPSAGPAPAYLEPHYQPTTLGLQIARRSRTAGAAAEERARPASGAPGPPSSRRAA